MLLLLKVLFALALLYFVVKYLLSPYLVYRRFRKYGFKHGPFIPILGIVHNISQSLKIHKHALHFFKILPTKDSLAKGYLWNWGSNVYLSLFNPELCKEFLVNNYQHYEKDPYIILPYTKLVGKRNIFFSDGPEWKESRKILGRCFHYEVLKSNIPTMMDVTSEVLSREIDRDLLTVDNFNVMNSFQEITGRIFISSFCGPEFSKFVFEGEALPVALANLLAALGDQQYEALYLLVGPKLYDIGIFKSHRQLNSKIARVRNEMKKLVVEKRREFELSEGAGKRDPEGKIDLITTVFESLRETKGTNITDEDILNEILGLFAAGTDTTGHLVTSIAYALTQYPDVYAKLMAEVRERVRGKSELYWNNIQNMPYLNAVIKETLRYFPNVPAIFPRIAVAPHKLGEIDVGKGDKISTNFCPNFFNPNYFTDPWKYHPERWLAESNSIENLNPFAFTPFSAGARNCIGQNMAMLEARVIMIYFLSKFEFSPKPGYEMVWTMKFLIEPAKPFLLDLKVRPDFAAWNSN